MCGAERRSRRMIWAAPSTRYTSVSGYARRNHRDLDLPVGGGEAGFDAGAAGGVAGRHPGVPHRVHLAEMAHVGEPDRRRQQLRVVGAGGGEQFVDLSQHLLGLLADIGRLGVGHLSGQINRRAIGHRLAHPRPDLVPLDRHPGSPVERRFPNLCPVTGGGQGEGGDAARYKYYGPLTPPSPPAGGGDGEADLQNQELTLRTLLNRRRGSCPWAGRRNGGRSRRGWRSTIRRGARGCGGRRRGRRAAGTAGR